MQTLLGTYEAKIDAKGRFMFPAPYKGQLKEVLDAGFVIKRSIFKKCLELFPMDAWQNESAMVSKLNMLKKKNAELLTKFMAGVKPVELDTSGSILIPKDLLKYAGIKKEIVLTSLVNKIEIWDKEAYEKAVDYDPDDFAALAEEVMGDIEPE
jgi:MraZ protein